MVKKIKWWWLLLGSFFCFIVSMVLSESLSTLAVIILLLSFGLFVWGIIRGVSTAVSHFRQKRQTIKQDDRSDAITLKQEDSPGAAYAVQRGNTRYFVTFPAEKADLIALREGGYVVFDLETTGLDPEKADVIEYAMLRRNADGTEASINNLCSPCGSIPPHIQKLTGISNQMVSGHPSFSSVANHLISFAHGLPIVAHNGSFDAQFLAAALNAAGLSESLIVYDTLAMAKRAFPGRTSYKLDALISDLGLRDAPQTHRAMDDVRCTEMLFLRCIDALLGPQQTMPSADGPLAGKKIVFTGELSIDRAKAQELATAAGAIIRTSVSGKTDYLVVGAQDPSLVAADGMSGKERKAKALIASGKDIKIINEQQFWNLLK